MSKYISIIFFLLVVVELNAQNTYEVKGRIVDSNQIPLQNIEVHIINALDSSPSQTYTDAYGNFFFYINQGKYTIQVYYLSDSPSISENIEVTQSIVLEDYIIEDTVLLDDVIVEGKKAVIKQIDNGFELNVTETFLKTKGTALDVLKYAPTVSTKNGVEVLGSSRYLIIYNGKELRLNEGQKVVFLESLKSDNIKSIEIIDSPDSATGSNIDAIIKIDAEIENGISGSLSTVVQYNNYFGNTNSIDLFYGNNKFRAYTSLYNSFHKSEFISNSIRRINGYQFDSREDGILKREEWSFTLGTDYYIDSLRTIGFFYNFLQDNDKDFNILYNQKVTSELEPNLNSITIDDNFEHVDSGHTFVMDYTQILDTLGSKLSGSLNYFHNQYKEPFSQVFTEIYTDDSRETNRNLRDAKDTKNLFTTKIDWDKKFQKFTFKTGAKYTYNHNENTFQFYNLEDDEYILDTSLSNNFTFKDNHSSVYASFRYPFKNNLIQIGSRLEYKTINFNDNVNTEWDKNFVNFLPTLYLKNKSIYLYYTKRINYPNYYLFNPIINKFSDLSYASGNPDLNPVLTNILQTGYTFKKKYNLILQYGFSDNYIYTLRSNYLNGATISKPVNDCKNNFARLIFNVPINFFEWWESTNKINFNYNHFYARGISDKHYEGYGSGIGSYHTFYLPKDIELSLDINFNTNNFYLYQKNRGTFSTNFGLNMPVFKKARLSLNISDVFNTLDSGIEYDFNDVYYKSKSKNNSRSLKIGFVYNFSSGKELDESVKESGFENEKDNIKK